MKHYKTLLAAIATVLFGVSMVGCSDDPELPPYEVPSSDWGSKVNMTVLDFKNKYWTNDVNYFTEVGQTDDGEDIYLGGYIVANDSTGNIYKTIIFQDETAAIAISVNMKDLYKSHRIGQQIFVKATGLFAGKRAGLFEIGASDYYQSGSNAPVPQIGYMEEETFKSHVEVNGWGSDKNVYTKVVTIDEVQSTTMNSDAMKQLQSQLVRINGVSWKNGGEATWATQGSSGDDRVLVNETGKEIIARNSGYSLFNQDLLPSGHGDVIAILSYYQTINASKGTWQLAFRGPQDCIDFGGESYAPEVVQEGDGTQADPYSCGSVISGASGTNVWVKGYIVGWIDGMNLADGARFNAASNASTSNVLIADNPSETNPSNCVPVQLSGVRDAINLASNPANLGYQVKLCGNLEKYFGAPGLKGCTAYEWIGDVPAGGEQGGGEQGGETPSTQATYRKATAITSGAAYVIVSQGKLATPIEKTYGYLNVVDATVNNDEVQADPKNEFVFTATTGGYTICQSDGRYLYQTGTYNSFNVDAAPTEGNVFTVSFDAAGNATITNVNVNKWMQYSSQYTSYGSYATENGSLPVLYEKVN